MDEGVTMSWSLSMSMIGSVRRAAPARQPVGTDRVNLPPVKTNTLSVVWAWKASLSCRPP
jgi:hypothetical protein